MRVEKPIPRDKVRRLILLIAITFAVLSVVTLGPARARLDRATVPPTVPPTAPAGTSAVTPRH